MDQISPTPPATASTPTPTSASTGLTPPGELLRQSWHYYKAHWKRLISVALVSWVIITIATLLAGLGGYTTTKAHQMAPAFTFVLVLYVIVIVIAACWQYVSLIHAVTPEGETKSWSDVYKISKQWLWAYLLAAIISGVLTAIGLVLLIIPGIIIGVWFSLASFIIVHENQSAINALKLSRNYVRGKFEAVLIRLALFLAIAIALSIIVGIIGGIFGPTVKSLANMVLSLFLTPFIAVYGTRLYQTVKQHS